MNNTRSRCTSIFSTLLTIIGLSGCQTVPPVPLQTVSRVDLPRFMGDWYVIANIPTFIEKNAHNAVESYRLNDDGSIATTFTFRDGSVDGKTKTYHPTGFVVENTGNAVWGMQFLWPIKADYRIVYLDDQYQRTIIGREQRDYVWIMARTPTIDDAHYQAMLDLIGRQGYDTRLVQKVPQKWN